MNLHSPARQDGETQRQYRERLQASREVVRRATLAGCGDQRAQLSSRQLLRKGQRQNGTLRGTYGQGVVNVQTRRQRERVEKKPGLRDANGALTLTGDRYTYWGVKPSRREFVLAGSSGGFSEVRRIWLAGISAQRGY